MLLLCLLTVLAGMLRLADSCQPKRVHGSWGSWAEWSPCTQSCYRGRHHRRRVCDSPAPANGGDSCGGWNSEAEWCNTHVPCPVDGSWSSWSLGGWSSCSRSCGGGTQTRWRTCTYPSPAYGGADCQGDNSKQRECNTVACLIDGSWGSWTESSCSRSCGGGTKTKRRSCDSPAPAHGGGDCQGDGSQQTQCNTQLCPVPGLIISGSLLPDSVRKSVEVYVPSTGQHCELPDLPDSRWSHSMEKRTICGGGNSWWTMKVCYTLTDEGTWDYTATLLESRSSHSSWASPSGLILLGGAYGSSSTSSEKIGEDGTSRYSFKLKYRNGAAGCAINLGSSVITTGGGSTDTRRVTEYNEAGWVRDLPPLRTGRGRHGCSYFVNDKGTKTFLVTGGLTPMPDARGGVEALSSTEVLEEAGKTWVSSGELPSTRLDLRGATIDNRILMTGGQPDNLDTYIQYDDILEYVPRTGQWKEVAKMKKARINHAVSTINFSEVAQFCKVRSEE